jgi:hypothetical protein
MSSQAKVAANRINGRHSRGPRTATGKWYASRNALRHGLTTISRRNPAHSPEIERIARAYCEGDSDPSLFEQAMIIAENDVILMRVDAEWLAAIARMRDPDTIPFSDRKASLARARARSEQGKFLYAKLMRARLHAFETGNVAGKAILSTAKGKPKVRHKEKSDAGAPSEEAKIGNPAVRPTNAAEKPQVPPQYDDFEAAYRAAPDLVRLERYRRRATSRRNRAIRELIFIKSLREFHLQTQSMHDHGQDAGAR